jgi:hypothetical protein
VPLFGRAGRDLTQSLFLLFGLIGFRLSPAAA